MPSNQTTLPAFTSQTSCGSFVPADDRSLYFSATSRKGGVQWFGAFRESRNGQGVSLNSKWSGSRELAIWWGSLQLHLVEDLCAGLKVQRSIERLKGGPLL